MPARAPADFSQLIHVPEAQLVSAVFADWLLCSSVGIPPQTDGPVSHRLEVRAAELELPERAFGDADALVVPRRDFTQTRAIEFKRVKISTKNLRQGRPSGLGKLRKAVAQANALQQAGFAFVWLNVIVVADVRELTKGVGFAGAPMSLIAQVYDSIELVRLHPHVGVTVYEITQVSNEPANRRGGAGGHMLRSAIFHSQPPTLTASLERYFARTAT